MKRMSPNSQSELKNLSYQDMESPVGGGDGGCLFFPSPLELSRCSFSHCVRGAGGNVVFKLMCVARSHSARQSFLWA